MGFLEASWRRLGGVLGTSRGVLGAYEGVLEASWKRLGSVLEASWRRRSRDGPNKLT